jgi:DNA-binding SARP family transcriptional activator
VTDTVSAMEFRLLGPVEAEVAGRPALAGLRRRERCLAALLLLEAGQVVSAARLAELLWDGEPTDRAPADLRVHVSRLRSHLAGLAAAGSAVGASPAATPIGQAPPTIQTLGAGYLLDVDPAAVDAHRFRRLVDRARGAAPAARLELLDAALGLWRGPALADVASDWLRDRVCADLAELHLQAIEERAGTLLELGEVHRALGELTVAVQRHPVAEGLVGLRMRALYLAGRRGEALDAFAELRRRLAEEYGLGPGPGLVELYTAVLRDDLPTAPAAVAVPPVAVPPVAVPAVRAPTVAVSAVGAPAVAGPAGAAPGAPAQLPAAVADFTGREREMARLDGWLAGAATQPYPAPVVLTGSAGVGKTALAVHWAHRVRRRYPDGQLYVNLRGFASTAPVPPVEALSRFLRALDVPPAAVPLDPEEAAALYRSLLADRRMLVLLDNAVDAAQVRPLLPGGPGCLALVTSRNRLAGLAARDGARRLTLDVLPADDARLLLARLLGEEPTGDGPAADGALAELGRACAYLPLALRVAAANVADRPGHAVADHVRAMAPDRVASLRTVDDEEAAVGAAFELSYRALPPAARRLFALLGGLPGDDVTVAAAAAGAGCGEVEAAALLTLLAGAHLLEPVAPGRYGCHDLLREYARQRATAEFPADAAAALPRLFGWYLGRLDAVGRLAYPERILLPAPDAAAPGGGFADAAAPGGGFADAAAALRWVDAERGNLLAAVRHAAEHGPHRYAWLLNDRLSAYYNSRSEPADWLVAATAAEAAAIAAGDPAGRASALGSLGSVHLRPGGYEVAARLLADAADWAERAGWPAGQASALRQLGLVHRERGELSAAVDRYRQALELDRRSGSPGELASVANLGLAYLTMGRLAEGAVHLHRAVELFRESGPGTVGLARVLNALGSAYHALGRLDEALACLDEALGLHRANRSQDGEGSVLETIAEVHHDAGRFDDGLRAARDALVVALDCDRITIEVYTRATIGACLLGSGRPRDAEAELAGAVARSREAGYALGEALCLVRLAEARRLLGDPAARADALRALDLAERGALVLIGVDARVELAAVAAAADRLAEARDRYRHAAERACELGYAHAAARALVGLAAAELRDDRADEALEPARRALAVARRHGFAALAVAALEVLAAVARRRGRSRLAEWHAAAALRAAAQYGVRRFGGG